MDFKYYIGFFHDGDLVKINHQENDIEFEFLSSAILLDWNKENIKLNSNNQMHGKLFLTGVKWINVNNKLFDQPLTMKHDDAEILDFEIRKNIVELGIEWRDFPPKPKFWTYEFIEIKADQIIWKNIPNDLTINITGLDTGKSRKD